MSNPCDHALQTLSDAHALMRGLAACLRSASPEPHAGIVRCIERLQSAVVGLDEHAPADPAPSSMRALFNASLNAYPKADPEAEAVVSGIRQLLPTAHWYRREAAPEQDSHFVDRHRHAVLLGPHSVVRCQTLTLAVAVMQPWVTYPFHQHPPEEFYLVMSPGQWYQAGAGWRSPGLGGVVYNPPSIIHAMKSESTPLLAVWGLLH